MKNTAPKKQKGKPGEDRERAQDGPRRRKLPPPPKQKYRHVDHLLDDEDIDLYGQYGDQD